MHHIRQCKSNIWINGSIIAEYRGQVGHVATYQSRAQCQDKSSANGLHIRHAPHLFLYNNYYYLAGFFGPVDAREAYFGPCVIAKRYAAVVDVARCIDACHEVQYTHTGTVPKTVAST